MKVVKQKKKRVVLGKTEKEILRLVGTGALVAGTLMAPNLPATLHCRKKKYTFKRSFRQCYDKNLIYLSGEKVQLSEKGQKLTERIQSEEVEIKKHEWDGIWRIVSYDIPEDPLRKERNYFRRKLKSLGFEELQKSMMVIPYECKEEIAVIAQNLRISPYVMHLVTDHLPRQGEMIKRFGLEEI